MIKMLDKNEILNRYKRGEAILSIVKNMGISSIALCVIKTIVKSIK